MEEETVEVDGGEIREVKQLCYFRDILDSEGRVERAVRRRVAAAWRKGSEISGLLMNRIIPLKNRSKVNDTCIRSLQLYGVEVWALTKKLGDVPIKCDRRMLRYMAGVS